jgi:hypothetical protein
MCGAGSAIGEMETEKIRFQGARLKTEIVLRPAQLKS